LTRATIGISKSRAILAVGPSNQCLRLYALRVLNRSTSPDLTSSSILNSVQSFKAMALPRDIDVVKDLKTVDTL